MSWSSKKQTSVALSTTEAEYVVAGQCCAQLLWMRQTLRDFGYNLSKVPLLCDNESAIRMADNPVEHNRTKHIDIRHHFLRDHQCHTRFWKVNRMRTMYVPGSVIHVHSSYIIWTSSHSAQNSINKGNSRLHHTSETSI